MNVNLDVLICMQQFKDITRVTIWLDLIIKENSNLNTNLNQVYIVDILYLYCSCYSRSVTATSWSRC
jgi:hypothetical protein